MYLSFFGDDVDAMITGDNQWAETGDRYLLKLFRDFVFHQQSPDGTPHVDFGHVVQSLNKVRLLHSLLSLGVNVLTKLMLVIVGCRFKRKNFVNESQ
jgi:hypothetical protein